MSELNICAKHKLPRPCMPCETDRHIQIEAKTIKYLTKGELIDSIEEGVYRAFKKIRKEYGD